MSQRLTKPSVSIVLPFFQSRGFLEEAIDSILRQQGSVSWELLLVDDGSDDLDKQIAKSYRQRYPEQISVHCHEGGIRKGISASRNRALGAARGELIAFLDADDTWMEHKLESQVRLMGSEPEAGMVFGPALRWWSWAGGEDVLVPAYADGYGTDCLVPGEAVLATYLRDESQTPCTGSVMIRRSVLQRVGAYEEEFTGLYDDQVLYAKICLEEQVYVTSDCVSRYRKHPESCCARAHLQGTEEAERNRFLLWLQQFRGRHVAGRMSIARPELIPSN